MVRVQQIGLEADGYVGYGLARATALSRLQLGDQSAGRISAPIPSDWWPAGALGWAGRYGQARLEYQREVDRDSRQFGSERVALSRELRPFSRLNVTGGAEYDLANTWFGNADLSLRYTTSVVTALVGARQYRPHFDLWTIWGAFSPVPYHAVNAALWVRPIARLELRGRWERYAYSPPRPRPRWWMWTTTAGAWESGPPTAPIGVDLRCGIPGGIRTRGLFPRFRGQHQRRAFGSAHADRLWLNAGPAAGVSVRGDRGGRVGPGRGVAFRRTVTAGTGRRALSRGPAAAGRERDRLESDPTACRADLVPGKRSGPLSASAGAAEPGSGRNAVRLRGSLLPSFYSAAELDGGSPRSASHFDHWQHRSSSQLRQLPCRSAGVGSVTLACCHCMCRLS